MCVDTLWKGRNVLSMVAAGCFFLLYLITGGFCIVWRNRYLVQLGEVLGSLSPLCYNIMGIIINTEHKGYT